MKTEEIEDSSRVFKVFYCHSTINSASVQQFKATRLPILIAFITNVSQMDSQLVQVLETVSEEDRLGYMNVALGDWNSLRSLRKQLCVSDDESAIMYLKRTKVMYFQ